jgi:hypothetical protein
VFEYLWIVILLALGILLVLYTVGAFIEIAQKYDTLEEALFYFFDKHDWLVFLWFGILGVITVISFAIWLVAKGALNT